MRVLTALLKHARIHVYVCVVYTCTYTYLNVHTHTHRHLPTVSRPPGAAPEGHFRAGDSLGAVGPDSRPIEATPDTSQP